MSDPMQFNSSPETGEPVEGNAIIWRKIAMELWKLLDDVDTAGDMFKPPIDSFFKYVTNKAELRHKYLKSDGYNLILTEKCINNLKKEN